MSTDLTPFELAALNSPGYEVWSREETSECTHRTLPHLLIVLFEPGDKPLTILDPQKNNEEILTADNYLEIVAYLRENDYSRLERFLKIEEEPDSQS